MSLLVKNLKVLLIGKGRWGKIMTKLMIDFGFEVFYVSKQNKRDLYFEKYIDSNKLIFFNQENNDNFDIVYICVDHKATDSVWEQFKEKGNKFLIEKPGSLNPLIISKILAESQRQGKYVFFNYEFYYENTSQSLRNILKESPEKISRIEILWQKDLATKDGIIWRLLPHMIAELFYNLDNKIFINKTKNIDNEISFIGKINNDINFYIIIKNNSNLIHYSKFKMFNGNVFCKDRKLLRYRNKIICENNNSSIENILNLLIAGDPKLEKQNHSLALNVTNTISKL